MPQAWRHDREVDIVVRHQEGQTLKPNRITIPAAALAIALVLAGCDKREQDAKTQPPAAQPAPSAPSEAPAAPPPAPKQVPLLEQEAGSLVPENTEPAKELIKKYGPRILYKNEQAKIAIESFNIDCRKRDNRYLPLINALVARVNQEGKYNINIGFIVQNASSETRVVRTRNNEPDSIELEINKWEEMNYYGLPLWGGPRYLSELCADTSPAKALYIVPRVQ
jgi:hypothetical protein